MVAHRGLFPEVVGAIGTASARPGARDPGGEVGEGVGGGAERALLPHEVDELFGSLRELTDGGATVIFISHKLDEVRSHADAITVIRDGRTVG